MEKQQLYIIFLKLKLLELTIGIRLLKIKNNQSVVIHFSRFAELNKVPYSPQSVQIILLFVYMLFKFMGQILRQFLIIVKQFCFDKKKSILFKKLIIMEDYQRRKLYRVHLKNISEIKNCRTPTSFTAYSSRLFNFNAKTTFRKRQLKSMQSMSTSMKLSCKKKNQQKKMDDFFREKQNIRLQSRLLKTPGSIDMDQYERQYQQHRKIMKLHRKIKQYKRAILYKIFDITFKGVSPNLNQQFIIYDASKERISQEEELLRGNIFQLRKSIIKGFRDQKLIFRIVGRNQGTATILNGQKMIPIMHRKQIVGTLIVQVC